MGEKMSREEVLQKLNTIFCDIFDDEEIIITEATTPDDIEDWDSIGHVYLTVEIEDEFEIKLGEKMAEIEAVSDIVDLILEKLH